MTISAPTFQRLQSGIKAADDLRVKEPINAMMAWLSGGLVTQLNSHFGAVSNSISAALATFLATANTWTAAQTIQLTAAGTAFTVASSDSGATAGPGITLFRDSGTPAISDVIGRFLFNGRDSGGNVEVYAALTTSIVDPTAGNEDAQLEWFAVTGGVLASQMKLVNGVQIGAPTGGAPGTGSLNVDGVIQKDGTQVVSSRVTGYGDPFGAISRATISVTTVTTAALASFVAAMYTDLKAHGLIGN
jgi:hypothetical protein